MEAKPYSVYIRADDAGRIVAINSDAFLSSLDGWEKIDEGYGDQYHHAQGNYFPKSIMDERGIYRYLHTPDAEPYWRERTQAEMDADYNALPAPTPTLEQRVETLEEKVDGEMADQQEALRILGL